MNVKELRIGNLVKLNADELNKLEEESNVENVFKIDKLDIHGDISLYHEEEMLYEYTSDSLINPIQLTEEWLIKFGFKITINTSYSSGRAIEYNVCRKDDITYNSLQDLWWIGVLHPKIKYVHQLQNLYFALTGVELKLKEVKK